MAADASTCPHAICVKMPCLRGSREGMKCAPGATSANIVVLVLAMLSAATTNARTTPSPTFSCRRRNGIWVRTSSSRARGLMNERPSRSPLRLGRRNRMGLTRRCSRRSRFRHSSRSPDTFMSGRSAWAASQVALIAPTEVPVKIENGARSGPWSPRMSTMPAMTPAS